jgi:hypothetical protein
MPIMPLQSKEEGEHYEILVRMRDEAGKIICPTISSPPPNATTSLRPSTAG